MSLNFGQALEHPEGRRQGGARRLERQGHVARAAEGLPDGVAINKNTAEATGLPEGTVCRFLPYIIMRTVDGSFVPWLASQTDLLAEDWTRG